MPENFTHPKAVTDEYESTREFRTVLRTWRNYLADNDGFMRAVTTCADQLEEAITRTEGLIGELRTGPAPVIIPGPAYAGPWVCMGCRTEYFGEASSHEC